MIKGAGHNTISESADYEDKLAGFFMVAPIEVLQWAK
jgi:hypothetical protein